MDSHYGFSVSSPFLPVAVPKQTILVIALTTPSKHSVEVLLAVTFLDFLIGGSQA